MLSLTKQTDYAFLLVSYLMKNKKKVALSQIVKETKLPQRFLARIASLLVKKGIINSYEGKVGGYELTQKAKKIKLYDFLKIFEGDLNFVDCGKKNCTCQYEKICCQKDFFSNRLNKILVNELQKWKLIDAL